jgi:hypothetical protein
MSIAELQSQGMKTDNRRPDHEEKMKRTPEQWREEWEKVKECPLWYHPCPLVSFSEFILGSLLLTHPQGLPFCNL